MSGGGRGSEGVAAVVEVDVVVEEEAGGAAHPGQVSLRVRKPVTQRGAQDPRGSGDTAGGCH